MRPQAEIYTDLTAYAMQHRVNIITSGDNKGYSTLLKNFVTQTLRNIVVIFFIQQR